MVTSQTFNLEIERGTRPSVLVVAGEAAVFDWSHQVLWPQFRPHPCRSFDAAEPIVMRHEVQAVLAEAFVGGRCGLMFLEAARERGCRVPFMLRSSAPTAEALRIARRANIQIVGTREPAAMFRERVAELVSTNANTHARRDSLVKRLCTTAMLTPAERETLLVYLHVRDRRGLAAHLGIAETSVRSRVRRLCRKLDIPHLHDVYRLLFEVALAA